MGLLAQQTMVQSMTNSRQPSRSEALSSRGGRTADNTESSTSVLGSHVPSSGLFSGPPCPLSSGFEERKKLYSGHHGHIKKKVGGAK